MDGGVTKFIKIVGRHFWTYPILRINQIKITFSLTLQKSTTMTVHIELNWSFKFSDSNDICESEKQVIHSKLNTLKTTRKIQEL